MIIRFASAAAVFATLGALPAFGAPPDVGNWVKRSYYLECRMQPDATGRFNSSAVLLNRTSMHFRPGTRVDISYHTGPSTPYAQRRSKYAFAYVGNSGLGAGGNMRLVAEGPLWAKRCVAYVTVPNASRTPPSAPR